MRGRDWGCGDNAVHGGDGGKGITNRGSTKLFSENAQDARAPVAEAVAEEVPVPAKKVFEGEVWERVEEKGEDGDVVIGAGTAHCLKFVVLQVAHGEGEVGKEQLEHIEVPVCGCDAQAEVVAPLDIARVEGKLAEQPPQNMRVPVAAHGTHEVVVDKAQVCKAQALRVAEVHDKVEVAKLGRDSDNGDAGHVWRRRLVALLQLLEHARVAEHGEQFKEPVNVAVCVAVGQEGGVCDVCHERVLCEQEGAAAGVEGRGWLVSDVQREPVCCVQGKRAQPFYACLRVVLVMMWVRKEAKG